jgi:import inner membrane translocase subunit TIM17
MKARAPVVGGNFGIWGGMFCTFDCAVKGWRKKEDAWNAIISGFMTGGCLALRSLCCAPQVIRACTYCRNPR